MVHMWKNRVRGSCHRATSPQSKMTKVMGAPIPADQVPTIVQLVCRSLRRAHPTNIKRQINPPYAQELQVIQAWSARPPLAVPSLSAIAPQRRHDSHRISNSAGSASCRFRNSSPSITGMPIVGHIAGESRRIAAIIATLRSPKFAVSPKEEERKRLADRAITIDRSIDFFASVCRLRHHRLTRNGGNAQETVLRTLAYTPGKEIER